MIKKIERSLIDSIEQFAQWNLRERGRVFNNVSMCVEDYIKQVYRDNITSVNDSLLQLLSIIFFIVELALTKLLWEDIPSFLKCEAGALLCLCAPFAFGASVKVFFEFFWPRIAATAVKLFYDRAPSKFNRQMEISNFLQQLIRERDRALQERTTQVLQANGRGLREVLDRAQRTYLDQIPIVPADPLSVAWNELGAQKFCEKHFNIKSPHFANFIKERVELDMGVIDSKFLNFALSVPKREELTIDALRKILIHPITESPQPTKDHLAMIFKDYTPAQIERIFTNHRGKNEFSQIKRLQHPAAIYGTLENLLESEGIKSPRLRELEKAKNVPSGLRLKVLQSRKDFIKASDDFINCVRGYYEQSGDVLTFYKESEPVACVHIQNQAISQIKGFNNGACEYTKEIKEFLKAHGLIR